MIHLEQEEKDHGAIARIKVVGVGGAGGNTINCMVESGFKGVEFYAINTDAQALQVSLADVKIQIGVKSTKGLGSGANPEIGKRAAEEDLDKIVQVLGDADIVFITGGMGKGTGSGAIPVITQALKEKGILTIVVVTKPFLVDGKRRVRIAEEALEKITAVADTLLVISNQRLLEIADETISLIDGFGMINQILNQSVRGISEIITHSGYMNVDFADVREIMKDKGIAVMGTARCSGQGRAKKAALEAISSPLLENMSIAGARSVLLNITGGTDLGLQEISEAASVIYDQADEDANIILGSVIDNSMGNEVSVTIIATGFPTDRPVQVAQPAQVPLQKLYTQPAYHRPVVEMPQHTAPQVAPLAKKEIAIEQELKKEIVQEELHVSIPVASMHLEEIVMAPVAPEKKEELSCPVKPLTEEEEFELLLKEEAEFLARKAAFARTLQKAHEPELAHAPEKTAEVLSSALAAVPSEPLEKQELAVKEVSQAVALDINDLDIPAFMRKQSKERRAE